MRKRQFAKRPGDKTGGFYLRMTEEDARKLEYIVEKTGRTKSDILRNGLDIEYQMAKYK